MTIFSRYIDVNKIKNISNPVSFKNKGIKSSLESKRLVTIGRLEPVKGYIELISSIKVFFDKYPDWHLDIYGDGYLRDKLQKAIEDNSLSNHIYLKGFKKDLEIELYNSSIFICSSKTEAFPMSFLEAMSLGIPIVSIDCPVGPKEIIKKDSGILVEDLNQINVALEGLIEGGKYDQFVKESMLAVNEYDISNITKKWMILFEK